MDSLLRRIICYNDINIKKFIHLLIKLIHPFLKKEKEKKGIN